MPLSSAVKGHAPDPNPSLSIVSKRLFLGKSVVKGTKDRRTFVRPSGLPKNSPKATAKEAKGTPVKWEQSKEHSVGWPSEKRKRGRMDAAQCCGHLRRESILWTIPKFLYPLNLKGHIP